MARFGIQLKSRRKAGIGGFHAEYLNDRTAIRQRKQMGFLRSVFTAMSLLFGAFMIYVAFHYIPAFVKPREIIKLTTAEIMSPAQQNFDQVSPFGKIAGPYVDMFTMNRAYLKAGQSVEVRYALPKGATLDVQINHCRRLWVVEIFHCELVGQENMRVSGNRGAQKFVLGGTGFYTFHEKISLPGNDKTHRVVWRRR